MNPIFGLFAAPAAAGLVQDTAKAAASPFDFLLKAACGADETDATAGDADQQDEPGGLQEGIARQLQQLLASLGVNAGEEVRLRAEGESGQIQVDGHSLAGEVEDAIANEPSLAADIQELLASAANASGGLMDAELQVEAAADQELAILKWR
jgi:hypothetical protein